MSAQSTMISIRIPDALCQQLRAAAEEEGTTVSSLVRHYVTERLTGRVVQLPEITLQRLRRLEKR